MNNDDDDDGRSLLVNLVSRGRRSFDDIIRGLVGEGPYTIRDPRAEMVHIARATLCGVLSHALVEWKGKTILFLGEFHGRTRPCPGNVRSSNFFHAIMHLMTESEEVALVYEGHEHMMKKRGSIIEKMAQKGYPFRALENPDTITRGADYLKAMRCLDVVLMYAKQTARVRSLRARMHRFDCRENLRMVSPWASSGKTDERMQSSMRKASEFLGTLKRADTGALRKKMATCNDEGCYEEVFIETPDHVIVSMLSSLRERFVIVYGGEYHAINTRENLLPGARLLHSGRSSSSESCSRPLR